MKIFFLAASLCLSLYSSSQGFINATREEARKSLAKYTLEENLQTVITETDSTLVFLIRDTSVQNLDLTLCFDAAGNCVKELRVFSCDSCLQKTLNGILNEKQIGWRVAGPGSYLSKFSKHLWLRIHPDLYSCEITRFMMGRREYKKLLVK